MGFSFNLLMLKCPITFPFSLQMLSSVTETSWIRTKIKTKEIRYEELLITCILDQGGAASPIMKVWWKRQSYCLTDVVLMGWQKLLMPSECILGFPLLHLTQPLHTDWQQYPFGNSKCNHPHVLYVHAYLMSSQKTGCRFAHTKTQCEKLSFLSFGYAHTGEQSSVRSNPAQGGYREEEKEAEPLNHNQK